MKLQSGQVEGQDSDGATSQRRAGGFGAAPSVTAAAGFGRRRTPIPETTDGMPPRTVANDDRGERMRAVEVELGKSFGAQAAHDGGSEQHAEPVTLDEI